MFERDYIEFIEVEDPRPTWFERFVWPVVGFWMVVLCSVALGICETLDALQDGVCCLIEDTRHAWRARK